MGWGASDEEKAQKAQYKARRQADRYEQKVRAEADREVRRAREQQEAEARAFAASPVGQARAAFAGGAQFYQFTANTSELSGAKSAFGLSVNTVTTDGAAPDVLGQIEQEGWHLEHVGYAFVQTGSTSSNRMMSTGEAVVTEGFVQGIYLFRRMS